MKKKLWMTFGPVLVAGLVFLFILFGPSALFNGVSNKTIEKSATSMNEGVIQGQLIQDDAFSKKEYLPIFGSSELSRIDMFHPSVYSQKYNKGYTPFLIGRAGTQSLTHYLNINSLGTQLKGKKVVFILSPQWFQPKGVNAGHFGINFSPLQAYKFALEDKKETPERRYAARRLLQYKVVQNDTTLKSLLENIATPGPNKPNDETFTRLSAKFQYAILTRKDELESKFVTGSREEMVENGIKNLPGNLSYEKLDQLAIEAGKANTGNNEFNIKQKYYDKKIKPIYDKLTDSRRSLSYAQSPEYADLQLVMDAFKQAGADVLFVNPPINGKWIDFIGMNRKELSLYYQKTQAMVEQNGFKYVSLEKFTDDPYFLEDPIHLSWRGWVQIDKAIDQFRQTKKPAFYPPTPKEFYLSQAPLKDNKGKLEKKN
ncbi:D-alanyl-lipoteichoic acid biosynthesis protein DltD [Listeria sp. PSOL-1]|uniref:D-alanyl-lipoteichoic acid biosynthesis protein DltD n=1 Tax=Listeria sp. PSOL-1 TaxID=1844999 RepID=UPI0013D355AF|nr:D-alanyl-lipoteichoic acid biosynthesis protein DltD [Listeria sp. PSOL-1]